MNREYISGSDFESVLSEVEMNVHLGLAGNVESLPHPDGTCEFCVWLRDLVQSRSWPSMRAAVCTPTKIDPVDLLLFLYLGIKLGRRQMLNGVEDIR